MPFLHVSWLSSIALLVVSASLASHALPIESLRQEYNRALSGQFEGIRFHYGREEYQLTNEPTGQVYLHYISGIAWIHLKAHDSKERGLKLTGLISKEELSLGVMVR